MFAALRHRAFRFLWLGTFLWSIARWMEIVVLGWLVLDMTGSPFYVGLVTAMRSFPFLFFGVIGGVAADRVSSRPRLLVTAQSFIVALSILVALLIGTGVVQVWHLMLTAFLSGTAMAFDQPARQSLVYDLVGGDDLVNALALNSTAWNLSRMLGPAAGGVLLAWAGPAAGYAVMSVSYLVGIGATLFIGKPANPRPPQVGSIWENLKEGLRYALTSPVTRYLLLLEAVTDVVALPYIFVLMPVFAKDVLQVGATGLGFMTASAGLGALAGALGIALLGNRLRKGRALIMTAFFYGCSLLFFSMSTWYPLSLVLITLTGMFTAIQVNLESILLQTMVPEEMRGRMMGVYVFTWGLMPIGNLQAGAVASLAGAPVAGIAGGLVLAVFAIFLVRAAPFLRRA